MNKYGRLTIISGLFYRKQTIKSKRRYGYVRCICDCGTSREYRFGSLKNGHTKSCGCYNKEVAAREVVKRNTTHGLTKHPIYRVWAQMKQRCYDINYPDYNDWGGRGITVCDKWKNDFVVFYEWSVNNGWRRGLQIDRIKNHLNYSPDNCRFITCAKNNQNRRSTRLTELRAGHIRILFHKSKKSKQEISFLYGVHPDTIRDVVNNRTWHPSTLTNQLPA